MRTSLADALARSSAVGQRLVDGRELGPAFPPILSGVAGADSPSAAVEVTYDPSQVRFPNNGTRAAKAGWWNALLPPHPSTLELGQGNTPLIPIQVDGLPDGQVWVKDESHNPTESHKDRLSRLTVGAAALLRSPGVVVASAGNHAVSTAAYAARAELPCVALVTDSASNAVHDAVTAYGGIAFAVPRHQRWPLMRMVVDRLGFHPVSNLTAQHSGHPYGAEGYKSIAYELYEQGPAPIAAVYVPTGYGELLFGIYKGFVELLSFGLIARVPTMIACEPAARGPLARSLQAGRILDEIPPAFTRATSIGSTVTGTRAVAAITGSRGRALLLSDEELASANDQLGRSGLRYELSSAASLAALRHDLLRGRVADGTVVCVCTASAQHFTPSAGLPRRTVQNWSELHKHLAAHGLA